MENKPVYIEILHPDFNPREIDVDGNPVNTNQWNELWESYPKCVHDIQPAPGGGVKCTKCRGWCCL